MEEKSKTMILVVDDTPENIDVLSGLLNSEYDVKVANKGETALKIATKKIPDLILLDIMMPEMDGYEVCRRLKADETTKEIPVIFITAKTEDEAEVKGFEVGGVDYITKPINPQVVMARVKAHLSLKREKDLLKKVMKLKEDVELITRHDLKGPLTAIINFPKLMIKDNLSEKQMNQLDKISKAGLKLLNMIDLSLDLYKMEQGTYNFTPIPVEILSVIGDIAQDNRYYIRSKRSDIVMTINGNTISEDATFEIPGEKLLFYSMLSNLIKNSLDASPRNEKIAIQLSDTNNLTIAIHNQGAVPKEIRDTFFDKYSTSGKNSGTGLGTYSARLIAETMGGNISMESSEENGTTVTIMFSQDV